MRLFEELVCELGDEEIAFGGAKIVLLAGRGAYFENVKSIFSLGNEGAVLLTRGGKVSVEGEGLAVARYGGGDLLLRGRVLRVELEYGARR